MPDLQIGALREREGGGTADYWFVWFFLICVEPVWVFLMAAKYLSSWF